MKYRNISTEIEALQLIDANKDALIDFCDGKIKSHPMTGIVIETKDGDICADIGDYVVKNSKGEISLYKREDFEKKYESINEITMNDFQSIDSIESELLRLKKSYKELRTLHRISSLGNDILVKMHELNRILRDINI